MHSLDILLSEYIQKSLQDNLGKKETKRIESELYSWYEINLKQSMTLFDKLHKILVNLYGKSAAAALEKRFVKQVIQCKPGELSKNTVTITLHEPDLIQKVFEIVKDDGHMAILKVLKKPLTIQQTNDSPELSEYSDKTIYRKMGILSDLGFVMTFDSIKSDDNMTVKRYRSTFDGMEIKIKDKISVTVSMSKEIAEKSLVLSTVFS